MRLFALLFLLNLNLFATIKVLMPLYKYPICQEWEPLCIWEGVNEAVASGLDVTVIVNPNNGPTSPIDSIYKSAINELQVKGVTILGYVSTRWAARPLQEVFDDIAIYHNEYNIDGIFIDEASEHAQDFDSYYENIIAYIKEQTKFDMDIYNFGIVPDKIYMINDRDHQVHNALIYEKLDTDWESVVANEPFPDWAKELSTDRFSCIIYNASLGWDYAKEALDAMVKRRCGYIYVTHDDNAPNPYDEKPLYWSEELEYINYLNNHQITAELFEILGIIENNTYAIQGKFINYGNGAFDWIFVTPDLSAYKLEGVNSDNTFNWSLVSYSLSPTLPIFIENERIYFGSAQTSSNLIAQIENNNYAIAGEFINYGSGAFDWIFVMPNLSAYKLEGVNGDNTFNWRVVNEASSPIIDITSNTEGIFFGAYK